MWSTKYLFSMLISQLTIPTEGKCPDARFRTRSISRNVGKHICNSPSALCSVVRGPKQTPTLSNLDGRAIYTEAASVSCHHH
jgi:hypothetical protein